MGNPGETLLFQHRKATFRAHALKSFKKRIKIVVGRLGGKVTEFYHPLAGISLSIGAFESSRGGQLQRVGNSKIRTSRSGRPVRCMRTGFGRFGQIPKDFEKA